MDNFGPENTADREALQRLTEWVTRLLGPQKLPTSAAGALDRTESRPLGGTRPLDAPWIQPGIGAAARGLDREAELLFFYIPPACPEADQAGEPAARAYGKPADHGDYPPQAAIGMAVTRAGIPVRAWCWPGKAAYPAMIRQVKDDMRDWVPARIVWVADRGFTSADNRRRLRVGGHHYIIAEKLCPGSAEAAAALSRQGRYQEVTANLRVKEIRVGDDERFVIIHDPGRAEREAAVRVRTLAGLEELIRRADKLSRVKRAEMRGVISASPGLNRYLRVTPGGRFRIHAKAVKAEEHLDGKYLLRASDPEMTPGDIALGYSQLLEAKRGWQEMNRVAGPRAACPRKDERVRAHVLLRRPALLPTRVPENACGTPRPKRRRELDRIRTGTVTGSRRGFS